MKVTEGAAGPSLGETSITSRERMEIRSSARMSNASDHCYMARALALAERGRYTTQPNPRVGCVVVKEGRICGEGWHMLAGRPHAEIYALRQAASAARGATVYISLEPCSHQGRTAPCTEALLAAGVGRVVMAMVDPNPLVSGSGMEQLREQGVDVSMGVSEAAARALNKGYISRMERGRPWVRVKLAASLDGRTALADGTSRWITGEAARRDVQYLRAESGAILTGVGTVRADDPSLNVRLEGELLGPGGEKVGWLQPLRVIADTALNTPPSSRLLRLPGQTLIFAAEDVPARRAALEAGGAQVRVAGPVTAGYVDLAALLKELGQLEVNDVLVEAGATLAGALLAEGLVDELIVYLAPHLLGDDARGMFRLPVIAAMTDRISLEIQQVRAVGADWRITAVPVYR